MFSNPFSKRSRPIVLGLLLAVVASGVARGQAVSDVLDDAGMFSDVAIRKAKAELTRIEKTHGVPVTIQTVATLKGETIDDVAVRRLDRLGHKGVFVLIAEREHKSDATASPRTLFEELGKARLNEIRDAFTADFKERRFDEGLMKGIQAADKVLAVVRRPSPTRPSSSGGFLPSTTPGGSSTGDSPLVLRQQVRLTLAGARKAIEGAEAKATKEGWKMNFAVVDDGGHLVAFGRMDGARPASAATSTTKAVSAATYRQPTGPIVGATTPGVADVLLNVSVQNASDGKITALLGGLPIVVDGQVIGAIGVGGGTGEQDLEAAKAGISAFLEGLQTKAEEPKAKPKEPESESSKPKEDEPKAAGPETAPK